MTNHALNRSHATWAMLLALGLTAATLTHAQTESAAPRALLVRLESVDRHGDLVARGVNACVDAVMARDATLAERACDLAVRSAQLRLSAGTPPFAPGGLSGLRMDLAAALNNRAVLRLTNGDDDSAKRDLDRAARLAPREAFVGANRNALERMGSTRIAMP
jgi:hypothetical protein